ncbi:MAG: hypothetical protein ACD_30C00092G0033 [uncultured bacterium]|uniref:Toxin YoeB n=3 Tax=Candidatus Daviesiibacteriota TaxID=1752718 RepID=A0A0G0F942_9BACT|nr:MAG: hypothetical protein ACD_30C00092G0033 [uncultured bacterium]KKQ10050.1 MAG: hypothetical protein US19_C0009G0052 [Candidatus Daviesbacteria bacterium GW2011_GWB1_36_5]KKQ15936.1 MAG: hypothetical protein US28_C0007G0027 [Candidatus Daviesbacteria bacterium GW2011_GWA1_36_8]OGE30779.1 MAG: hypothetical protein A3C99_00525 [Candidatus Daviesbacteria bacterium RIFCSPHIGHO2_02_FULL_37_9]OGE35168.1 MAG: hypothetical protein A3E66_01915 [Candidatus Daviesbacteria bacterium RIFCSPHIGHO2_12_FU
MQIKPLSPKLVKYLTRHNLTDKFNKQLGLFKENFNHPSLNTEKLAPRELGLYSLRIDRKYRAVFHILPTGEVQFVDINDHYQ